MPTMSTQKEAYYLAVDNTDYPQNMKKYIKKLISNCASPDEIFQLTLLLSRPRQTQVRRCSPWRGRFRHTVGTTNRRSGMGAHLLQQEDTKLCRRRRGPPRSANPCGR